MNDNAKRRGRPPKARTRTPRPNVTIRMTQEQKARLEADCTRSGRSLSEEIAAQLERCHDRQDQAGGPTVAALLDDIASAFRNGLREGARTNTGLASDAPLEQLMQDAWCYDIACRYVERMLVAYDPSSDRAPLAQKVHDKMVSMQGDRGFERDHKGLREDAASYAADTPDEGDAER